MPNEYVNEVIFGNETIMSVKNDTVTPQTLLSGATAHDRSGAPIVGTATQGHIVQNSSGTDMTQRSNIKFVNATVSDDSENDTTIVNMSGAVIDDELSTISENPVQNKVITGELDKAYKDDDTAETDIANDDYVPFYDASASTKKKSLWSNIIDKIKTALGISSSGDTYLKKDGTWGTPTDSTKVAKTGDTMTGNLNLIPTDVDASSTDNNVSSTKYPTTFNIIDTDRRIITRLEGVVESNGNIGSYWYVRNYDTNGDSVAQKGISMSMAKDGTFTYIVSDSAKFRSAIDAAASSHTHSYVPLAGGTMTGALTITRSDGIITDLNLNNKDGTTSKVGVSQIVLGNSIASGTAQNSRGLISMFSDGTSYTSLWAHKNADGTNQALYFPGDKNGATIFTNQGGTINGLVILDRRNGTTSEIGYSGFILGNNIKSGTDKNSKGYIRLYSQGSGYMDLKSAGSHDGNYELLYQSKSGTIALTSDLPTNQAAASGGTANSLVTTGDKYNWNSKAAGNHTHTTSIATDSGTNQLTLAASTKYKLTAGGTSYIFTTPPNTNTTYSFATGDSNGQIKVTPSGGTAQNVSVKGLGTAAYTASTAYAVNKSLTNENLNSVTTAGFYSAGGSNTCTNTGLTSGTAFGLQVVHSAAGSYYYQIINPCGTSDFYRRICADGTWGSWTKDNYTNTWRGIQNNLTSSSTDMSLSANQGRLLANGSARDDTKVKKAGDTMTGILEVPYVKCIRSNYSHHTILNGQNKSSTTDKAISQIALGNETKTGTVGNSVGDLTMYSNTANFISLRAQDVTTNRWLYLPASGTALATAATSSYRVKENIRDMTDEEALKILDVSVVKFDYKEEYGDEGLDQSGVIAEEVIDIIPEVVNISKYYDETKAIDPASNPSPTVDYGKFAPYLIKMIQIQQEKIEALEQRIEALENNN